MKEEQRKGERKGGEGWREGREGQRWGIYMTGAIGYGELSWINSLFTLAGRLLSEAGDVGGASGDPALCYGERRAGKRSPKWLAGMSPGTMPRFSTTAASIIIRGRPSPWKAAANTFVESYRDFDTWPARCRWLVIEVTEELKMNPLLISLNAKFTHQCLIDLHLHLNSEPMWLKVSYLTAHHAWRSDFSTTKNVLFINFSFYIWVWKLLHFQHVRICSHWKHLTSRIVLEMRDYIVK